MTILNYPDQTLRQTYTLLFYKNLFCKNIEAEDLPES